MSTAVTVTGTGCPIPSAERAGPGVLVRSDGLVMQFDAGRSTVQRLAQCELRPGELDAVFVTHHHSDHLTGLQDLVLTRWLLDRDDSTPPLPIVAPAGPAASFVERMLDAWDADIEVRNQHTHRGTVPRYDLLSFAVSDHPETVWSNRSVRVLAGPVRHEPVRPAVGYRIETPDGVVAITGDTRVCDEVARLATGADVIVYEALRFEAYEPLPNRPSFLDYHADTRLIGSQVAELGVDTLVLTHLIPEPRTADDRQRYVDDIRGGGFTGRLVVADDLSTVEL